MFNLNLYKEKLSTEVLGQSIQYYQKLDSTNTKAFELISRKIENGTIVITENQLKGRGRHANKWISIPNKSLTFSIIIYPKAALGQINFFSLIAGLAVTDCLNDYNFKGQLKWPNDILIDGKKVGGILCESKISGEAIQSLVIGIGLNINVQNSDLPQILKNASSLFIESGKQYQIEILLVNILINIENRIKNAVQSNSHLHEWEKRCAHLNQEVSFHTGRKIINGIFKGLSLTGQAIILIDNKEVCFDSGELIN